MSPVTLNGAQEKNKLKTNENIALTIKETSNMLEKFLQDTLQNEKGLWSSNAVMRAAAFGIGAWLSVYIAIKYGADAAQYVMTTNYVLAFGITSARMVEAFKNRATADADGPLMQKGTEQAPTTPVLPIADATAQKEGEI